MTSGFLSRFTIKNGRENLLCDAQGYRHRFEAPDYYIETAVGKWRLDTRTHPVDVYHINLVTSPDAVLYHKQHRLFLSLADTLEYIRRHDSSLMEKTRANAKPEEESQKQCAPTINFPEIGGATE